LGILFHWDVMATNRIAMNQPNQAAGVVPKLDATNFYSMIMKKVVNIGNPRILGQTPYALKMRYIPKILGWLGEIHQNTGKWGVMKMNYGIIWDLDGFWATSSLFSDTSITCHCLGLLDDSKGDQTSEIPESIV
jgi:hypothetical protein